MNKLGSLQLVTCLYLQTPLYTLLEEEQYTYNTKQQATRQERDREQIRYNQVNTIECPYAFISKFQNKVLYNLRPYIYKYTEYSIFYQINKQVTSRGFSIYYLKEVVILEYLQLYLA